MTHLSAGQVEELLAQGDAVALAAFVAHLEAGCEACEEALELPLEALAALVEAERAAPENPTEREQTRLRVGVAPHSRPWLWPAAGGLLMAALALLALRPTGEVPPAAVEVPVTGVKGIGSALVPVELSVVAGRTVSGSFVASGQVESGQVHGADETLLFKLSVAQEAARYLFVVDGEGGVDWLWPAAAPALEAPGPRRVQVDGDWLAYALSDVSEGVVIVAGALEEPSSREEVLRLYQQGEHGFSKVMLRVTR